MIRPWPYVALGLVLAAVVAGALVGLEFAAFGWFAVVVEGTPPEGVLSVGVLAAVIATPVFLAGLIFPGLPTWLWLHGIGQRSYRAAAFAVAAGASVAGVILTASAAGWWSLMCVVWLGLPGAAAGLVLRSIACSRPKPPPARPS